MSDTQQTFQSASRRLRVQPPHSAWKRIESRLETQDVRRVARLTRFLSYAAAIVLLLVITLAAIYLSGEPELYSDIAYSRTIVELEQVPSTNETIYDVDKVKSLRQELNLRGY